MRRIVIVGKTGSGKSSLGNTIFGEDQFTVCHNSISAKSSCEAKTQSLNGIEITLIDTPGFFDTNTPEEKLRPEITKCITECSPGPHAFLIVLKVERFTDQENNIIKKIIENFSEEVFKFATVVFTHGDDLQEGQQLINFVSPNTLLSELVEKCGGRCHVIDNKYWKNLSDDSYRSNSYQVKEILKSVEEIVKANNGNCYTNEMLQKVEEMTQQAEKSIELTSGNMSREEMRQKAKSRVFEFLVKAAGITTGALLAAIFGRAAAVEVAGALSLLIPAAGTTSFKEVAELLGLGAGLLSGAYIGYQVAEESETPGEAIKKTAEAVRSSGKEAIKQIEEFRAETQKLLFQ